MAPEHQLTTAPCGHILTNINVWSPDSRRIVYDIRSDASGSRFDGTRIETVDIHARQIRVLYESRNGAHCGVASFSPTENKVAFILGPENPTLDWSYNAYHRQGVIIDEQNPGVAIPLDARDLTPPFTPGALRGGTHVHIFSGDGHWLSFTYEDHILAPVSEESTGREMNPRTIGVSVPRLVNVPKSHPRNHDGQYFSVLAATITARPRPGTDDIRRAVDEAWIGRDGYIKPDGSRQKRALAFQGEVVTSDGRAIAEVFISDLPGEVTRAGDSGPLEGTSHRRPQPPAGTTQRRLTFTSLRKNSGLQGPRHWLRSSPDGVQIAFSMKDNAGIVQLWTVSPNGGESRQLTHNAADLASAFSWSPDGRGLVHVMDTSVCVTSLKSGTTTRLTPPCPAPLAPRPEACVISPDGAHIAYVKPVRGDNKIVNQVFICPAAS